MIEKIDLKAAIGTSMSEKRTSALSSVVHDFESLLEERLGDSKPLEMAMIELLSRTLKAFESMDSSHDDSEGSIPFPSLPGRFSSSPSNQSFSQVPYPFHLLPAPPVQPSSITTEEVSTILQAQQEVGRGTHDLDAIVTEASRKYGVEPGLIKAVIEVESSGNPAALSPQGAQGLMQLMPGTAAELGVRDAFDPGENVMGGTRYLRQLLDRYRGDVRLSLAAYNWGMGNLERNPKAMPKETRDYIAKVEKRMVNPTRRNI